MTGYMFISINISPPSYLKYNFQTQKHTSYVTLFETKSNSLGHGFMRTKERGVTEHGNKLNATHSST